MSKPKLIIILGPTASGKSSLALQVAKEFNGEVIQADSRTIFKGMNIGTAKPSGEKKMGSEVNLKEVAEKGIHAKHPNVEIGQLFSEKPFFVSGIPHWGIDLVNPDEDFTAAQFKTYAEKHIFDIVGREKVPILAGGTGLYINAIVDNLKFTDVPANKKLRKELEEISNEMLIERLRVIDPEAADAMDVGNRRRILRAIEIVETSGKKLAEQQSKGVQKFEVLMVGIDVDREKLYGRINLRVDEMIAGGLVDEVRELKDTYGCEVNAMTGIGYRQVCAFLDGYMKLRDAIEAIKRDSRHYAKRQVTWFRRDNRIHWVKESEEAISLIENFLK